MKNIPCWPDKALRDVFLLFLIKILLKFYKNQCKKAKNMVKFLICVEECLFFYSTEY